MEQLNAASVLPVGLNFLEHVRALPASIREVVTHGLRHGAASSLTTMLKDKIKINMLTPSLDED